MLRLIRIRDFALISSLEAEFGPALNLLTGETGSGKSILVDALGLLVGGRTSPDLVRSGSRSAILEAVFTIDSKSTVPALLEELGVDNDGDELIIRREIALEGKNRVFLNNHISTLQALKRIGECLVDIHGQHDHQALLDAKTHISFLDQFGRHDNQRIDLQAYHDTMRRLEQELCSLVRDEQDRLKRMDTLRYQIDQIRHIAPSPHELEELGREKKIVSNRERIFHLTTKLYQQIYENESSILAQTGRSLKDVEALAEFDSRWQEQGQVLAECLFKLEDIAYFTRDYMGGLESGANRLEEIENRLTDLQGLIRKYGHSVDEVLEYAAKCEHELKELGDYDKRNRELESQLQAAFEQYSCRAEALSLARAGKARVLEKKLRAELEALSMERARFRVRLGTASLERQQNEIPAGCRPSGIDRVEFEVATNQGEDFRPLAKVASGGEISRLILSLKTLCGEYEAGKTLVFDEVDSGIGGRVAEAVGQRLSDISTNHQVFCVTHLPQIAAFADQHFSVEKHTVGERTETSLRALAGRERVDELARMLGGQTITQTTRRHAKEMLTQSAGKPSRG